MYSSNEILPKLEAMLVGADRWVKISDLAGVLGLALEEADDAIREFEAELLKQSRGIQLRRRAGTVRIEVKASYVALIGELFPKRRAKPISDQADEVLAVIAHMQPISVQGISDIRGVDSAAVVMNLAERGLIQRLKRLGPNRERLWKVSRRFLEMHSLNRVEEIFQEDVAARVFPRLTVESYSEESQ
jgi:segregation and condensation protein B